MSTYNKILSFLQPILFSMSTIKVNTYVAQVVRKYVKNMFLHLSIESYFI